MITYSRDALAAPVREVARMYDAVREGRFLPDASRSGRFPDVLTEAAQDPHVVDDADSVVTDVEVEDDDEDADGDMVAVAVAEEKSVDPDELQALAQLLPPLPAGGLARHRKTLILHALEDSRTVRAPCAVRLGANHVVLDEWPAVPRPLCKNCWPEFK